MLIEEFKKTGNWLFRWRSYLPLVLLGLAIPAVQDSLSRPPPHLGAAWEALCLVVALSGLAVRILTVGYVPAGTSGRNTLKQVASSLNVTGIALLPRCWWFTVITVLIFWLYYERIMFAEECFLLELFGEEYRQWAARTPAFLPKFKNWVKPGLPFSLKSAISREYSTFFTIIIVFTLYKVMVGWLSRGTPVPDLPTTALFFLGLLTYVSIRVLKKNTRLLREEGR
jgi:hypothetical protein